MKILLGTLSVLIGVVALASKSVVAQATSEQITSVSASSRAHVIKVELRLSKREELDRLLSVLKTRKEALCSLGQLEGRDDGAEIERALREEIDQLLLKINRLAAELHEDTSQELEEMQSSGWVTKTLTCSSLFLLSMLALAMIDPADGIHCIPSTTLFEKNMECIVGFFGY